MFEEPEIRPEVEAWLRERAAPRPAAASRYELLDGDEVALPAHTEAGVACLNRLTRLFTEAVGDPTVVSVQNPVDFGPDSQPCPDIALFLPADGDQASFPRPQEILLLVEVADTAFRLSHTRGRKAAMYARRAIPECWIVDVMSGQLVLHRSPASGGYRDIRNLRPGSPLVIQSLPDITVDLARLLGQ